MCVRDAHTHVCMYVDDRGVDIGCLPQSLYELYIKVGSLIWIEGSPGAASLPSQVTFQILSLPPEH